MNIFKGRHFKYDMMIWAVRWYCRYGISYRDLEEMLGERGVGVDHSTIYRWVQYYAPKRLAKLQWYWKAQLGFSWRVDETYVKVKGKFELMHLLKKGPWLLWKYGQGRQQEIRLITDHLMTY